MKLLLFSATLLAAIIASVATLVARETLVPLPDCPSAGADSQCMVGGIVWVGKASQIHVRRQINRQTIRKTFLIEGSLNGGPTKPYALEFVQSLDDYFARMNNSGPVAHLGSFDGAPLIFTNRGTLLIETKSVHIEDPPNIVVIDDGRSQVLARYYDVCTNLSFLNTPRLKAIWDEGGSRCVSVLPGTGNFVPGNLQCARPPKDACDGLPVNFVPAPTTLRQLETTIRDLQILDLQPSDSDGNFFGGNGWAVWSYRVPHSHFRVVYGYCGDCDDDPHDKQR